MNQQEKTNMGYHFSLSNTRMCLLSHCEGVHSPTKKVNHVASFYETPVKLLSFAGAETNQKIPGRGPEEFMVATKYALPYTQTGTKDSDRSGEANFVFNGRIDADNRFRPHHMVGKANPRHDEKGNLEYQVGKNAFVMISETLIAVKEIPNFSSCYSPK